MIAIAITPCSKGRAEPCPAAVQADAAYCLHDCAGVHLGTIPLPVNRPTTGPSAPTVYLRRDGVRLRM
jgi:hypothetical protein